MALIRLQHRAPSLRTYVIPVEHGGGEVHALGRVTRDPKSGTAGVRVVRATLPTTITLCARGTEGDISDPLDEAVLAAPEIAAAVLAKTIVVVRVPVAAAPVAELPAVLAEPSAPAAPFDATPAPSPTHASKTSLTPKKNAASRQDQE